MIRFKKLVRLYDVINNSTMAIKDQVKNWPNGTDPVAVA
jgi:hypothetical protein